MDALTERQKDILAFLSRTEILASVENLTSEFDVSACTMRTDIRRLVELGYVSELGEKGEKKLYRSSGKILE